MAAGGNARSRYEDISEPPFYRWREKDPAKRAVRFIEKFCRSPKGHGFGYPMKLAEFQKKWIVEILAPGVRQAILQCPRGQGKSTLLAALAVWALFDKSSTGQPQIPIMATTVGQAKRSVYDVAVSMIAAEPELSRRSITYTAIGDSKVTVGYNGGSLFPIANDVTGLQGLDPGPLAIADEIGFQPLESWSALVLASGKRERSLVCGIGTPGLDRETSALWHLRSQYLDGHTPPGFSYTELSAPDNCDFRDERNWRIACPALDAGYQSIDALRVAVEMSPESHFRIFHLGQWCEGTECWLGPDGAKVWGALQSDYELVEGELTYVGIDVGLVRDSTAVVIGQRKPDGTLHTEAKIWMPAKNSVVDITEIIAYIRDLDKRYKLVEVAYDSRLFELPGIQLADEGLPMVNVPQSLQMMTPACGALLEAIKRGEISHNGDKQYERQILNAMPRHNESGFTLSKRKSRGKIDAAVALAMMFSRAQYPVKPKAPAFVL